MARAPSPGAIGGVGGLDADSEEPGWVDIDAGKAVTGGTVAQAMTLLRDSLSRSEGSGAVIDAA